jgi:hypothetical protein
MILWIDFTLLRAIVRTVEGSAMMTKDNPPIFPNRRTLQEMRQLRKRMVAHVLKSQFKREFKTCRMLVGNQMFTIDLMSEDGKIAAKIINQCMRSNKKICSGKFQNILSAILILKSIDVERKLLIFTNKKMYEEFSSSIASMPKPIRDAAFGIIMSWIPLPDEFDNYEYSEPATAFRDNQNSFHQRRGQQ